MADRKRLLLPRLNLEILQPETLFFLAEDSSTDGSTLDLIAKYFLTTESLIRKIFQHPNVWKATLNYVRMFGDYAQEPWLASKRKETDMDAMSEPEFVNLFQQVQQMKVSEKIQLALKGNKEARALLLKDSNKQVILAVLNSPRLTEQEVESIAQSKNVSEDILRVVANNRNWMKNYGIIVGLVNNPKTPVGLSLGFIKNLKPKELNNLAKNKGVPEVIRSSAGKFLQMKRAGK
ncbi:hypothetical protein [Candidatus Manganitrophus noduliformans]|uniref:Uncharacterized protein n=1 Tax=Candidatus Manganitrophus noduliformans TaxID=2606439 RepID=A0A7X6DPU6_9BACT|nr:hypothetical protein [Candidatus Manganitrophus noduliformans]NKE71029.1 hypothetical protein [Candidatus Manganitrophus noduliformans]